MLGGAFSSRRGKGGPFAGRGALGALAGRPAPGSGGGVPGVLAGRAFGAGTASGALKITSNLVGNAVGAATASAALTVASPGVALVGSALGAGSASGALTVTGGAPVYDPDAQTAFDAMTVQPDAARKQFYSDLIAGLKADGVWAKLDWLNILAAHDAQAARLNLRNPSKSLQAVNLPAFTVDRGYSGDGTSSYLDFQELLSASGNLFSLNSATIGVWCNQENGTIGASTQFGHINTNRYSVTPRSDGGNSTFRMNDATDSTIPDAVANTRRGFRIRTRVDASTKRAYTNGVKVADLTVASTALATGAARLLASGTTSFSSDRLAAALSGSGFTDADATAAYNRFNTFLTAIGAN